MSHTPWPASGRTPNRPTPNVKISDSRHCPELKTRRPLLQSRVSVNVSDDLPPSALSAEGAPGPLRARSLCSPRTAAPPAEVGPPGEADPHLRGPKCRPRRKRLQLPAPGHEAGSDTQRKPPAGPSPGSTQQRHMEPAVTVYGYNMATLG